MNKLYTLLALTFCNLLIAQPGSIDPTFAPGSAANARVQSISLQSDGKFIIGGEFNLYAGSASNYLARINSNGTIDNTFAIGTGADNTIYSTKIQPTDGKVIISGYFTTYNGSACHGLARINTDGSFDATFIVGTGMNGYSTNNGMVIQPDGKIIVAGLFNIYNGASRNNIARVNTDGSNDVTFTPGTGANGIMYAVALQPDGKIIIGGSFTTYNGTSKNYIARLNANGTLDATFNTGVGTDAPVYSIIVLPNGKILIGGGFGYYDNNAAQGIARLNSDGTIDNTFSVGIGAGGSSPNVWTMGVQTDGKIFAAGEFLTWNGVSTTRVVRLNADGSADPTFVSGTGASSYVVTSVIQPDGKIMIGGNLLNYNGTARNRICRINGNLNPIAQFTTSANSLCGSGNVTLTDASSNFPTSWTWSVSPSIGTNITSSTSQNTNISFSSVGSYTVKLVVANVSGIDSITHTVDVFSVPTALITAQGPTVFCQNGNVQIDATAAASYIWSNGATTQSISASQSGNYSVVITDINGCSDTSNTIAVVENNDVSPEICMVTVDDPGNNNIIYWDKTNYGMADTFFVYREITNGNFQIIGKVPYDSLSQFVDTVRTLYFPNTGDPRSFSYKYRLAIKDTCGNLGAMSLYHGTMFLQDQLNGNFNWTHYEIEGQTAPVSQLTSYVFLRDNDLDFIYETTIGTTTNNLATDSQYSTYQFSADWRVETNWSIACTPTMRLANGGKDNDVQTTRVKSKSNVRNNRAIGIKSDINNLTSKIKVYPNPTTDILNVEFVMQNEKEAAITMENMLGQIVYTMQTNKPINSINTTNLMKGVYFVKVNTGKDVVVEKIVIE